MAYRENFRRVTDNLSFEEDIPREDKELRNSGEINLTSEQIEILSLYEDLRKKEEEITDLKAKYGKLEDQLFDQSSGFDTGARLNKLEKITSQSPRKDIFSKINDLLFFVYVTYLLVNSFFSRPEKHPKKKY